MSAISESSPNIILNFIVQQKFSQKKKNSIYLRVTLKYMLHPVSSRKIMEYITITVGEQRITSKQSIKYLGVMIDSKLTFKEHLTYTIRKCAATTGALAGVMPSLGASSQGKRQLLVRVVRSIALYVGPIRAEDKKTY